MNRKILHKKEEYRQLIVTGKDSCKDVRIWTVPTPFPINENGDDEEYSSFRKDIIKCYKDYCVYGIDAVYDFE